MEDNECGTMIELRIIKTAMSEEMKGMTSKEIVEFINTRASRVEKEYGLNLPTKHKADFSR